MSRTRCVRPCVPSGMLIWPSRQVRLLTLLTPQVLRLENRVLELELQGDRAAPAKTDPGHLQAFAQELEQKVRGQEPCNHHSLQVTMSTWRA